MQQRGSGLGVNFRASNSGALLLNHRKGLDTYIQHKDNHKLWTIVVILLILWLLGFSFHIAGGLIYILLVLAVVVLVINLISGRRPA